MHEQGSARDRARRNEVRARIRRREDAEVHRLLATLAGTTTRTLRDEYGR